MIEGVFKKPPPPPKIQSKAHAWAVLRRRFTDEMISKMLSGAIKIKVMAPIQ